MEIHGKQISKTYADKTILENINFSIKENQKIGILGKNGQGKSTLLKIITNEETFDENINTYITKSNDLKISYLSQSYNFELNKSILENAKQILTDSNTIIEDYQIISILNKFDITDVNVNVEHLSGGQKRRIALSAALLQNSNLLILDEPTNHLDEYMIQWLEKFLIQTNKSILMVTHDRYFLENICNTIWEIDKKTLFTYNETNYSKFLEMKAQRTVDEQSQKRKLQSLWNTEAKYLARGAKARATKNKIRVENFEGLTNSLKVDQENDVIFTSNPKRLGKEIINIENVSKQYKSKVLFNNFTFKTQNTSKIGIVGKNGVGKSTLLKLLNKTINPDSGFVEHGKTVKIGYFSQESMELDEELRAIDYIKEIQENVKRDDGSVVQASIFLEQFNFDNSLQSTYIKDLSGGQKRRLHLIAILMQNPNVLLLDEPTNDLDLDILLALENFLLNFPGVIICISHDRLFLDKITTTLFIIEDKKISTYNGSFLEHYSQTNDSIKSKKKVQVEKKKPKKDNFSNKFSYKEKQEFDTIDDDIEELELKIRNIDKLFSDPSQDLMNLSNERSSLEMELFEKQERWFYLNEKFEQMNS